MTEPLCDCFGDSGLHASTHVPIGSRWPHCDLCGRPVPAGATDILTAINDPNWRRRDEMTKPTYEELAETLKALTTWAEHTGGWEAPVWRDAEKHIAALAKPETPAVRSWVVGLRRVSAETIDVIVEAAADADEAERIALQTKAAAERASDHWEWSEPAEMECTVDYVEPNSDRLAAVIKEGEIP